MRRARQHITAEGARHARLLPSDTVLVTCIGATIGKIGLARVECTTNQQINAVVVDQSVVSPEWLYWVLRSPAGQDLIKTNASATTLPILNKSKFCELIIPLPPLAEQREIVTKVEAMIDSAVRTAAVVRGQLARAARLRRAILKAAFSGELTKR